MVLLLKLKKSGFRLFLSMRITAIVIMVIFIILGGLSSVVLRTIIGNLIGVTILWILLYKFENILNIIISEKKKKAINNLFKNNTEFKKKIIIRRKKIGKALLFVGGIILLFLSGRLIYKNIEFAKMIPDTKDGVVINGVRWATSNVGASSPKKRGNRYKFYQAQDACPTGWRVPTREEFQSLLEIEKVSNSEWKAPNGVEGRIFTDKITGNSIFLPDTKDSGVRGGQYWSSTKDTTANVRGYEFAYYLHLWGSPGVLTGNVEIFIISLRCVKD
jgi:uncharacterized protein (TIGR02145 family)